MKKRFLALIMACVLACGALGAYVTGFAAEKTEMQKVTCDENAYDGQWSEFNGGFKIRIPDGWTESKLTDELKANHVKYKAVGTDGATSITVQTLNPEDTGLGKDATLSQLKDALSKAASNTNFQGYLNVNGVGCVVTTDNNNLASYSFLDGDGTAYIISVGPVTQDNISLANEMLHSISHSE